MDKNILKYSEELLDDFCDFLVNYEGNCGGIQILDTKIIILLEDGITRVANRFILDNLIDIFLRDKAKR